jgi:hypothetical protein
MVTQLLVHGAVLFKVDDVVLLVVGAGEHDGHRLDLGSH